MTTDLLDRPTRTSAATAVTTTRVRIRHRSCTPTGQRWSVTDDDTGEQLIERARDPEHEVCRLLLARGVTGPLETFTGDRTFPSFRKDIETAAGLTVSDTRKAGPRVVKWSPVEFGAVETED